jgi:predicted transcriptional regulator
MAAETERTSMPNDVTDPETGRFVSKYPDEAFVDALRQLGETGTGEIARKVGCNRETARVRLADLAADGVLDRRRVGNTILWSPSEAEA